MQPTPTSPVIVISDALLHDQDKLRHQLKILYTGVPATFRVYVHEKNLPKLEKVFDEIIMKEGIRDVNFNYILRLDHRLN